MTASCYVWGQVHGVADLWLLAIHLTRGALQTLSGDWLSLLWISSILQFSSPIPPLPLSLILLLIM